MKNVEVHIGNTSFLNRGENILVVHIPYIHHTFNVYINKPVSTYVPNYKDETDQLIFDTVDAILRSFRNKYISLKPHIDYDPNEVLMNGVDELTERIDAAIEGIFNRGD